MKTIAGFFGGEIKKLGWTMQAINTLTETSYVTQYDNDNKYLQLTVSQITGQS